MHLLLSQAVHILCYSPISLLTYYVLARMLKVRRTVLFAFGLTTIHVLYHILYTLAVLYEVPYADLGRTVGQIAIDLIVPLVVLKERKPGLIILGVSMVLLAGVFGEVCGITTFSAMGGIFDSHSMTDPFINPKAYAVMYLVNLTFTSIFLVVFWFLWNRIVERSRPEMAWYFMLFPTSQVVLLAMLGVYTDSYNMPIERYLYMIPAMAFCVLADIILFRSMRIVSQKAVADERALWYEQLLDQQQNYYSYILADQEEASHIRHDMRNQLQTVYALMESGDSETARKQLGELTRKTDQHHSFCQNRIVDAILHVKELQFRDHGIRLQCQCSVPEDLAITGTDLCSLFSNLLDNAANAVDSLEPKRKTISLSSDLEGNVFTVRCENPYPGEESIRPSHRPDGHGLGLSILEDLAKRHQGELSISTEKDIFTATVWLFVSSN